MSDLSADRLSGLGARVAEGSLSSIRARYQAEVVALIDAAHRVQRRRGGFTVGEVLEESGLGTRAFYRHFASKDELVLAMFEFDAEVFLADMMGALSADRPARQTFEAWLDWYLAVIFEPARAARFMVFSHELGRLALSFPERVNRVMTDVGRPLLIILEAGLADGSFPHCQPRHDARVIGSVIRGFLDSSARGELNMSRPEVHGTLMRFFLPALGAK